MVPSAPGRFKAFHEACGKRGGGGVRSGGEVGGCGSRPVVVRAELVCGCFRRSRGGAVPAAAAESGSCALLKHPHPRRPGVFSSLSSPLRPLANAAM